MMQAIEPLVSSIDFTGKAYILSLHQFQYTLLHHLTENHSIDEKMNCIYYTIMIMKKTVKG